MSMLNKEKGSQIITKQLTDIDGWFLPIHLFSCFTLPVQPKQERQPGRVPPSADQSSFQRGL